MLSAIRSNLVLIVSLKKKIISIRLRLECPMEPTVVCQLIHRMKSYLKSFYFMLLRTQEGAAE